MRLIFFLFFILLSSETFAQKFPFEYWHEGKIVLESGDTLTGNVKYDLQSDLLEFEKNRKLESFTARKVLFFQIFDKTVTRYRSFYSLPYSVSGGYKAPVFFELLAEGKMTLLCREAIELRSYPSSFYYYGSSSRQVLVYHYFILKDNGTIESFDGKKSDLLSMMGNYGDTVEAYMKKNKLKVDEKYHLANIVVYYNSLYK
ncbi:hypothetical protein BH09BAC3_BH09BAC3_21230 [soil metagenome]